MRMCLGEPMNALATLVAGLMEETVLDIGSLGDDCKDDQGRSVAYSGTVGLTRSYTQASPRKGGGATAGSNPL